MGISQYRLAKEISVPAQRIGEFVAGKRAITADTGLRLCRWAIEWILVACASVARHRGEFPPREALRTARRSYGRVCSFYAIGYAANSAAGLNPNVESSRGPACV
jgi:hypothetical protein